MKPLLDENVPQDFRHLLPGHEVETGVFARLNGLAIGALLAAAADRGYDVLITLDQNIEHQQNLSTCQSPSSYSWSRRRTTRTSHRWLSPCFGVFRCSRLGRS